MSGSTLGTLFRVTNFGESPGPAIGCVIDGCPPGMALSAQDIQPDLDRRRPGTSRHVTQRSEADEEEDEINLRVKKLLNDSLERAEESPSPDPDNLTYGVYATPDELDKPHH